MKKTITPYPGVRGLAPVLSVLSVLFLFIALTSSAASLKWSCNWPEAKSQTFSLYHGETAQLQPSFYVNGVLATNLTIEAAYYQTNGMADAWWQLPGATFAPSNDCGAASYRFFVRAVGADGVNYRANGLLRMIDSPGFTPSEVALPVRRLDFSTVELVNPPYYTKAETDLRIVELSPPADLSNATNYTDSVAENLREGLAVASSSATNYTDNVATTLRGEIAAATPEDYDTVKSNATVAAEAVAGLGDLAWIDGLEWSAIIDRPTTWAWSAISGKPTTWAWSNISDKPSWIGSSKPSYSLNEICPDSENWLGVQGNAGRHIKVLAGTVGGQIVGGMRVTASTQNDNNMTTYTYGGVAVRRNGVNTDYVFDESSVNGIVRRSELASKANAADVATISAMLNAENARFVSTNYNSSTHLPAAYVEAKVDGNWLTIWNELTRWNWLTDTYLPTNFYNKSQINSALDDKADRAWGFYDSHSGLYAPDGYTWVSSPKIAIAGGLAYSRTVTAEGAVWVLESNGMVTETGGVVSNGFFRVSDDEGNALFEVIKGDKRIAPATPGSCQTIGAFTPTKLQVGYAVVAESHPTLYVTASIEDPDWHAEDDASCPANVTWSGSSGDYTVVVQAKSASATELFVKASYEIGGETYIKNTAPVSVDGGILCTDGVHKVRPVYNNGNIAWEVVQ